MQLFTLKKLTHLILFTDNTNFDGLSPYDLADMIKEYFRDLPDPIFTSKLAETFISIHSSKTASKALPMFGIRKAYPCSGLFK